MSENVKISAEFEDNASPGLKNLVGLLGEFIKGVQEGAKAELDASKASKEYNNEQGKTSGIVKGLVKELGGLAAAFFSVKAILDGVVQSIQNADKLDDLSDKTGIAAGELNQLAYAAKIGGTSLDGVVTALNKLQRSAAASEEDVKKQALAFKELGIETTDANGNLLDANTLLLKSADAFSKLQDGPEKTALAYRVFGGEAKDLIPLLNRGADGIAALKKEQEELSGVKPEFFTQFAKASGDLFDNIDKLGVVFNGFFTTLSADLVPILNVIIEQFVSSAKEGGLLRDVLDGIAWVSKNVLVPTIQVLAVVFDAFTTTVKIAGTLIGATAAAVVAVANRDFKGAGIIIEEAGKQVEKYADEHVKFTEKLALAGHEAVKLAGKVEEPKRKVTLLGKAAKDTTKSLEDMVASLRIANQSFGLDESAKQRLELEQKVAEAKKNGANPARVKSLQDEGNALIELNRVLRDAAKAQEEYEKARASQDEQQAQNDLLAYENTLIGKSVEERTALIAKFKEEQQLRKDIAKLSDDDAKKIAERQRAINDERAALTATANDVKITNEILAQSRAAITEDVTRHIQAAAKLLEAGKITVDDYNKYQLEQLDRLKDKTKEVTSEMQTFWKAAGEGIQGDLQSFIFDFAQGKLTNLVASVKTTLDRIVAQILAAKLATALFGADIGKGNIGGLVGQAGSFLSGLFGGFRATGGPVQAGKAYVVGEMRPELFVPRTSGTIIPDTAALSAAGGTTIQASITIQANDAASFLQQNERVKRELTKMLIDTANKYNIK